MIEATVFLPVYNAEGFILEAINSILKQSYKNFEFLIIDDGSTDQTLTKIKSVSDDRIRLITHEKNLGLIATLNEGLLKSIGDFIIRMDADDISHPKRIEYQINYLKSNPDIDVVGTFYQVIGENKLKKFPIYHDAIKVHMLFHTSIAHPTIAFRKEKFINNNLFFNKEFNHAEDYELWIRSITYLNFANLQVSLLQYRVHSSQVSSIHSEIQKESMQKAQVYQLNLVGIYPSEKQLSLQYDISNSTYKLNKEYFNAILEWLKLISEVNSKSKYYSNAELEKYLSVKWYLIAGHLALHGIQPTVFHFKKHFKTSIIIYIKNNFILFLKVIKGNFIPKKV